MLTRCSEDPAALDEIFNGDHPPETAVVWHRLPLLDVATFDVGDRRVVLEIAVITDQRDRVDWILEPMRVSVPASAWGHAVMFSVSGASGIARGVEEFAIFSALLRVLNRYFSDREWDYLWFRGDDGSRHRLYQALAQRMAKSKPCVERIAHRGGEFAVTRF